MVLSEGARILSSVGWGRTGVHGLRTLWLPCPCRGAGRGECSHLTQPVPSSPQPAPGKLLSQSAPQPGESALGSLDEGGADPGLDGGSWLAVALVGATLDALVLWLGEGCCYC